MKSLGFRPMVHAECANLAGVRCIIGERPCSVLLSPAQRCSCGVGAFGQKSKTPYFERCVLPLAKRRPEYAEAPAEYFKALERAAKKDRGHGLEAVGYRDRAAREASSMARCLDCGGPRERRKLYCDACRAKRRREAYRKARRMAA